MLEEAEDHLARIMQRLGPLSSCVVVSGAARVAAADDEWVAACSPEVGLLPPNAVRDAAAKWAPEVPLWEFGF